MPIQSKLRAFWRCRPRVLTIALLLVVAAMLVLSNLTFDRETNEEFSSTSFGWPLIWYRAVGGTWYQSWTSNWFGTVGWYFSGPRLAGNLLMWLAMLAAPAGACEWLLRRYRPGLRWSLRTMLAAVALAAAFCAWFAAARKRADLQDWLFVDRCMGLEPRSLLVERRGPKWLDLVGADRFRRDIVFAITGVVADEEGEEFLRRLSRLPKLRTLLLSVDRISPAMADALNELRRLRKMRLERRSDDHENRERSLARLPPIGKMAQLEELELEYITLGSDSLASLANLRSLSLKGFEFFWGRDKGVWNECLAAIPEANQIERLCLSNMDIDGETFDRLAHLRSLKTLMLDGVRLHEQAFSRLRQLPRLEIIGLNDPHVGGSVLRDLARLPHLKSLVLDVKYFTTLGLEDLASLESLEELTLVGGEPALAPICASEHGLDALLGLKHLKVLHVRRDLVGRYMASLGDPNVPQMVLHVRRDLVDQYSGYDYWSKLLLDDGYEMRVPEHLLAEVQRGFDRLRKSHPGIVIDGDSYAAFASGIDDPVSSDINAEGVRFPFPAWLPANNVGQRLTPSEQADFEKIGGWASFDGAGYRNDDGRVISVSF